MHRRTKLLWWLLSLSLLILVLIPVALYFLSPIIAHRSLEHWLESQQFSDIKLEMQPPAWNELRIERLALKREDSDKRISLETGHVSISYNPYEIFNQQRFKQILLTEADIQIEYLTQPEAESTPSEELNLKQLLPDQWFDKIPIDTIRIGELSLSLRYPDATPDWQFRGALLFEDKALYSRVHFNRAGYDLGWGDIQLSAQNGITLRMLDQDNVFFSLQGRLTYDQALSLDSQQNISLSGLKHWISKWTTLPSLPDVEGEIHLTGTSHFPLKTHLTPDALLQSIQAQQTISGQIRSIHPIQEIGSVSFQFAGDINFSLQSLGFTLEPESRLTLSKINHPALSSPIENLAISLTTPFLVQTDLKPLLSEKPISPLIPPVGVYFEGSPITAGDLTISPFSGSIDLTSIDLPQKTLTGQINLSALNIALPQQKLPLIDLTSTFELSPASVKQRYGLKTPDLPFKLNGEAKTDLITSITHTQWAVNPIPLAKMDTRLQTYLKLPPELSLLKGQLYHRGRATVNKGYYDLRLDNSIRGGDLNWNETRVRGLSLDSQTRIRPNSNITDTGSIKLKQVKTGIEATDIETRYRFSRKGKKAEVSLTDTRAKVLQGLISFSDMKFNPVQPDISTAVSINNLDLGEILKLEQQQGLSGTGKLSGHFPLVYRKEALTVKDGQLKGRPPGGTIKFEPTPTVQAYAATNMGLNMAIEALSNFHYELLEIQLDYLEDGTALMKTRLKGNNPDWNQGHPIDFKINVEENIPKLIKTLQFADKLTRTIEKRYR